MIVVVAIAWPCLTEAHMHITAIIPVGNHMLPLRKLYLCNGMTIVMTHLTQLSKQEHNELTGVRPGITSMQVRPVMTYKERYQQSQLLPNPSWQQFPQPIQHHQHPYSLWGQVGTTWYWIGQSPPIPSCITRQLQCLTTSSTGPWKSS